MKYDPHVYVAPPGEWDSPAADFEQVPVEHQTLSPKAFQRQPGTVFHIPSRAGQHLPWAADRLPVWPEHPQPPRGLVCGIPRKRLLLSVVLVGAVYALARADGWVGPGAHRELMPELLWPAVIVIGLWGLSRILRDEP